MKKIRSSMIFYEVPLYQTFVKIIEGTNKKSRENRTKNPETKTKTKTRTKGNKL